MADFLTRLIQRASGRAPVIRPVVRSSYGASLQVNESVGEFEETVTFEGTGAPASTNARSTVRNNLLSTGSNKAQVSQPLANSEIENIPVKSPVAGPVSRQQSGKKTGRNFQRVTGEGISVTSADSNNQEGKSTSGRKVSNRHTIPDASPPVPQKNLHVAGSVVQRKSMGKTPELGTAGKPEQSTLGRAIPENKATPSSSQNIIGERDISDSSKRMKQVASPQDTREVVTQKNIEKTAGRPRMTTDAAPPVPPRNLRVAGVTFQRKPTGDIPGNETIVSRQPGVLTRAEERIIAPMTTAGTEATAPQRDSRLVMDRVQAPSQNMVIMEREESTITSRQEYPGRWQSEAENVAKFAPDNLSGRHAERSSFGNENPPSTNIRVTIGRVEIRAVQPPERQAARPASASRKPAVTLDAYLKARNEEKR